MRRPTQQEIDDGIVDTAARLFAQHGYDQTSVQRIADEVGYSKTGLLHRFPSKDVIQDAVRESARASISEVIQAALTEPVGPGRERAAVEAMVAIAMRRPGVLDLLLNAGLREPTGDTEWVQEIAATIFTEVFAVTPTSDVARQVQVLGALGALGIAMSAMRDQPADQVRAAVVATVCDTLQHGADDTRS